MYAQWTTINQSIVVTTRRAMQDRGPTPGFGTRCETEGTRQKAPFSRQVQDSNAEESGPQQIGVDGQDGPATQQVQEHGGAKRAQDHHPRHPERAVNCGEESKCSEKIQDFDRLLAFVRGAWSNRVVRAHKKLTSGGSTAPVGRQIQTDCKRIWATIFEGIGNPFKILIVEAIST